MIKLEKSDVYGLEAAIRGMRNPMNSWNKSDSIFNTLIWSEEKGWEDCDVLLGENDLKLMKNLSKAGNDHSKFLRMINVTVDITAPLYWFKEFDTYKVGTVANSCSTMHKIHEKNFTLDAFSHEQLDNEEVVWTDSDIGMYNALDILGVTIEALNCCRNRYLETKDKKYWWQMIQLLPSSYNQKRTVQLNYQVLKSMYFARRNHKLDEWRDFCKWCEKLPYFQEICVDPMEEAKPEIAEMVGKLKGE